MKKISILGSTGSIGTQTLEVIRNNLDKFLVESLACKKNIEKLKEQAIEFRPKNLVISEEADAVNLIKFFESKKSIYGYMPEVSFGEKGLVDIAEDRSDLLVNALMGMVGLVPTYYGILAKKNIALANKETLVAGGSLIMEEAKKQKVKILPIDSEHSAIFQCLMGNSKKDIKKILLTASGGPFRNLPREEFKNITVEDALKHPSWSMGKKITIDSATMMNKGLEVIEAKWLFGVTLDMIEVLVHPQSIMHSAVEFKDNSIIAQMGTPDMKIPISLALEYPNRLMASECEKPLDFFGAGRELTFEKPRFKDFPCLKLAYDSEAMGGTYSAVLNGANEMLVDMFLNEKIGFLDIEKGIRRALENYKPKRNTITLESILEADAWARKEAKLVVKI